MKQIKIISLLLLAVSISSCGDDFLQAGSNTENLSG
jgi:hypothetical protein